jgi:RsiW-degrading membrane proteinase PrsW (M82 family)
MSGFSLFLHIYFVPGLLLFFYEAGVNKDKNVTFTYLVSTLFGNLIFGLPALMCLFFSSVFED